MLERKSLLEQMHSMSSGVQPAIMPPVVNLLTQGRWRAGDRSQQARKEESRGRSASETSPDPGREDRMRRKKSEVRA